MELRWQNDLTAKLSQQIPCSYQGIHIASAAPDEDEQCGIPHHLIEILSKEESCSVADYVALARKKIDEIIARGHQPIVVGGTGLYINALFNHTQFVPEQTDLQLREKIEREYDALGGEEMHRRLEQLDPETAHRLHPNDRRRIVRAFEVLASTGRSQSEANAASHSQPSPFEPVLIGLTFADRQRLYDRINLRVDLMMQNGLLEEARSTLELTGGYGLSQAIGHKELYPYFTGEKTLEQAVDSLKQATRRYAKRQLTWFRRDERIHWIELDRCQDPLSEALLFISTKG